MFICIQQFCKLHNQLSMQVNLIFVIKKTNEQHIENLKPDYKLLGISSVSRPTYESDCMVNWNFCTGSSSQFIYIET